MSLPDLGPYPEAEGYDCALHLDEADPLSAYRSRFTHPEPGLIYLDGNSLGMLPAETVRIVRDVTERQWGERLIRSWNEGWWNLQVDLGDLLAPLLGASPGEVIISDSTSVNLYKLAMAALASQQGRTKVVTDDLNFPTDVYVLRGVTEARGARLEVVSSDGVHGPVEGLTKAIDSDTALVALSHTTFKSGYIYDMGQITRMAHDAGALVLWDCSHSVGAMAIDLRAAGADLAVGCTYKYLNGGPGSPAFLYVRRDLQDRLHNPISAWWGHADPFAFDLTFEPVSGIRRFHTGTMPILSLAAAEAGIRGVSEAGIEALRAKSIRMGEFFVEQWQKHLARHGFRLRSPSNSTQRGSHVALGHDDAWTVTNALIDQAKVVVDFRTPDSVRFGFSALYNSFAEIHTAVQRLVLLAEKGYAPSPHTRPIVT
ncbi:MAG: kynureninase [Acidimicrobiia bacterium]